MNDYDIRRTQEALAEVGVAPAWTYFGNSWPLGDAEAIANVRGAYRLARAHAGAGPLVSYGLCQWGLAVPGADLTGERVNPVPVWSEEQAVARWWNDYYRHDAARMTPRAEAAVRADLGPEWAGRLLPATDLYPEWTDAEIDGALSSLRQEFGVSEGERLL